MWIFQCEYFVLCSFVLYSLVFCFKRLITFENAYLLYSWLHYIKIRFCEIFTVTNSVTRILLMETLHKFRTIKCWFSLYLHMYTNVLYIPASFLVFHSPMIFALQQLKISEICTLFQPVKLQIFCILIIYIYIYIYIIYIYKHKSVQYH